MTRTCRALHHSGARYLLQGDIRIWCPEELASLCQYISRDVAHRSRYIRSLDLEMYAEHVADSDEAPQTAPFVTLLSEYAGNLETLSIAYTELLAAELNLVLPSLSHLRSLILSALSKDVEGLLKRVHSPLRVLNISLYDDWWTEGITADPAVICAPFKDVLEVLDVSDATFETSYVQYPSLTTLVVHGSEWAELKHIFQSFPNLANLRLLMFYELDDEGLEDTIDEYRMLNVADRERGCWAKLQRLESGLISAYMLGVQSIVGTLSLMNGDLRGNIRDCDRLRAVLTDTRPAALILPLRIPSTLSESKFGEVLAPAADRLTTLVVYVETSGPPFTHLSAALVSINFTLPRTCSLCMPLESNTCSAVDFQGRDAWHPPHLRVLVVILRCRLPFRSGDRSFTLAAPSLKQFREPTAVVGRHRYGRHRTHDHERTVLCKIFLRTDPRTL